MIAVTLYRIEVGIRFDVMGQINLLIIPQYRQRPPLEPVSNDIEGSTTRCIYEMWDNVSKEHRARCQKLMVLENRYTGASEDIDVEMQPNEASSCQTPLI